MGYLRVFTILLLLSILLTTPATSQSKDLQEKILYLLRNPIPISDDSFNKYLESSSLLTVSNEDAQPTQVSAILNFTNMTFTFVQSTLHDNISTAASGYSMRFTVNASIPGTKDEYLWMRLPKNITLTNTTLLVAGLMSSSEASFDSKVYSVGIGEISGAFNEKEIVVGTDDGNLYVISSGGLEIIPLEKSLDYPIYAVAAGDVTSRNSEDYAVGLSNGTLIVFTNVGNEVWSYSYSVFPIYALEIGDVADSSFSDVVYGTWDKKVILINSSGDHVWNYTVGSEVHGIAIGNVSADYGNEVVVASYDGYVYVLNSTGSQIWNYSAGGWVMDVAVGDYNTSSPGNEVIYTSNNFNVYVLNSDGDTLLASYATNNYVAAAEVGDVLQDSGVELVAGSWDKSLYVFNSSGSLAVNRSLDNFVYDVEIGEVFTEEGLEIVVASGGGVYMMNYRFFTRDPYIDLAGSGQPYEWNYTGIFRDTELETDSYISLIQAELDSCNQTLCDIPFTGHSEESGVLRVTPYVYFDYNATRLIDYALATNVYSKTEYIEVNEVVGTELINITYPGRPEIDVVINYIQAGEGATECDFNSQDYLTQIITTNTSNITVCDISSVGRVIKASQAYDLPGNDSYWDNTMASVIPAILVEDAPSTTNSSWRKNITITNGTGSLFRNIIAYTSVNDSLYAQELRVDWQGNGTYEDITPAVLRLDCNSSTPTYTGIAVGSDLFYVCQQDENGNGIVDYYKWIQPYINKTTRYFTAAYVDYAPELTDVKVTPSEAPYGTSFNFSTQVSDQENQDVEVTLYVNIGGGSFSELGTVNVSGSGVAWINLTSDESWIGNNNSFYFTYTDQTHPLYTTSNVSAPNVTGHGILFESVVGNNSVVARSGLNSTELSVVLRDEQLDSIVGAGVNCSFIVKQNGVWAPVYSTTTDSNGRCSYGFDPDADYGPGHRKWIVEVSNNLIYQTLNSSDYYVNITGEANLSLTVVDSRFVRGQNMNLIANVKDEFDQDGEVSGATCRWYLNGNFRGTSQTNATGYCIRSEATACDTWNLGVYTVNATLGGLNSPFWLLLSNSSEGPVTLTDLVSLTIDNPANASIVHKGDTVQLNSTAVPSVCAYAVDSNQIDWFVGGTYVSSSEDTNWTVPITETVGPKNLAVNASGNYSSNPTTQSVYVYGYSKVQSISPALGNYIRGTQVSFTCKVVDANLSNGIENYTVYFYKEGTIVNSTQTDLLGDATWGWDTTNESEGTFNITCMIQNASNLYYTASPTNSKEAAITVTHRMSVLNITFDNSSIYRKDTFTPNAVNITAMAGKSITNPVENAIIHLYLPLGEIQNCTTDSTGYCSFTYNPVDNITPNNYTLTFNATKSGELSSFDEVAYLQVKGVLNITIDSPTSGGVVHKGDSQPVSSTIRDEFGEVVATVVVYWNDSNSILALGEDTIWVVSSSKALGPTTIYAIATKSHYNASTDNKSIEVWGWVHPTWVSPKFEMSQGVNTFLVCNVSDSNSTEGIGNYPVSFYYNDSLLGSNSTGMSGEAQISFTPTEQTTHAFKCGISDYGALYYNASKYESDVELVFVYPLISFSGDVLNALGEPTNTTFRFYFQGFDDVTRQFTTDENGAYDVFVHNKTSNIVMTLNDINASVRIDGVDFSGNINDPIDFDLVSGTETTLVNDVRGFAVNTTYFTGPAQISLNYSESEVVESEDYLSIYYCSNWDYTQRRCLGQWIQLKDSVVNKPMNTISINVTNLSTTFQTAYMIAENLPSDRLPKIGFINATPLYTAPRENITLFVSVSDVDLDHVNATLGDLTVSLIYNTTSGLFEYPNITTPVPEGEYALTITVVDAEGNIVSNSETVITVDDSNPIIRLISPSAGATIRSSTIINLSVTDATLDSVWFNRDGGVNTTLASPYLVDSTGWSTGSHTLNVYALDKTGRLELKSFTFTIDNTIVAFTMSGVNSESILLGGIVRIEVNVTSGLTLTSVSAQVTDPSGNSVDYPLTNDSKTHYLATISGLTAIGDYDVTVTATDSSSNTVSQTGWFEVYDLREFYGDVLNALNQPVDATIRFLRPNTTNLIEQFSTDSNGEYNIRIHNRTSDVMVEAFDHNILLEDVNLATLSNDPIDVDRIEGSDIYVPGGKAVEGIALKLSTSHGGGITFNYREGELSYENQTKIFECANWDYVTRICSLNWTDKNATYNRVSNTIETNTTILAAYALTEQLVCGNNVCETAYGENCFVCELDCGPCDLLTNITIQARRPPSVDLDPIEEKLENHSEALSDLRKMIEEFRAGINLSALEARIKEQFLTVEDISTVISLSQRSQALVPGLQIVSAELYPGESIKTSIHVKNILNETALVYVNVSGKISTFMSFEKPIVELPTYGEDDVSMIIFIPLNTAPAAYYGEIKIISGDVVANIPVNLRVLESREKILDLKIQVLGEVVSPGDQLRAEASIYNLGGRGKVEGELLIQFVDIRTNDVLVERSDNISVETTVSVVKALNLSANIPEGRYVVRGRISYVDLAGNVQYVSSIGYVTVRKAFFQLTFLGIPVWLILLTVFTLTGLYVVYLVRRRQIERRKRYLEAISFKALPQAGPRAGFIGRIAETDIRAFIEIDKG